MSAAHHLRARPKNQPQIEQLETRECPALTLFRPTMYALGDGATVAVVSVGRVDVPEASELFPRGRPEAATSLWRDAVLSGFRELRRRLPLARLASVQIPSVRQVEILGISAVAGRYAQVVVMPWTLQGAFADLGLFRSDYPWSKYRHPDTIYIGASARDGDTHDMPWSILHLGGVGDSPTPRSPANYRDVYAAPNWIGAATSAARAVALRGRLTTVEWAANLRGSIHAQ